MTVIITVAFSGGATKCNPDGVHHHTIIEQVVTSQPELHCKADNVFYSKKYVLCKMIEVSGF